MFIDGVVIGVIVALIMGGKLKRLLVVNLKHSWLIPAAFTLQYASIFIFPDYLYIIIVISNMALLTFCYLNANQAGFKFMTTGILLNVLVMVANGGRMPVDPVAAKILSPADYPALIAGEYGKHLAISAETHLNFLGDIFFLNHPYPRPIIISPGDIILTIGVVIFLYYTMVPGKMRTRDVIKNAAQL